MGERGRRFVTSELSWNGIAAQMREVYRWMLEGGETPPNVLLD